MSLSLEQSNGGSFCLSKAGLGVGSTATQLSTANPVSYTIDGIFQAVKAATATFAAVITPVTIAETWVNGVLTLVQASANAVPVGGKCAWGVWADSAGVLTVTQGVISQVTSVTDKVAPPFNPGFGRTLIGVFTTYAATAPFVLGTNVLTAGLNAGVNVTYFDVFSLPLVGF